MSHHNTPRDLPHKPSGRDDNLPMGRLGHKRAESVARIGADVYAALMIERTLLVAISVTRQVIVDFANAALVATEVQHG